MTLEDLLRLATGIIASVPVCKLPGDVCEKIGARTNVVKLSSSSLVHIIRDHKDATVSELCMLPEAVQWGLLVQDAERPNHIISCYQDPYAEGRRYIAVMKLAAKGSETWIQTFHRSAKRQTRRILSKGLILKRHDRQ